MGNWFSSTSSEKITEVNGQSTNVIVEEEGLTKIDAWHTIMMISILVLLLMQFAFTLYKLHKRSMKKKYLTRIDEIARKGQV